MLSDDEGRYDSEFRYIERYVRRVTIYQVTMYFHNSPPCIQLLHVTLGKAPVLHKLHSPISAFSESRLLYELDSQSAQANCLTNNCSDELNALLGEIFTQERLGLIR
jgi:hypothetical protein